jgi:hypothetical protein
MKKIALTLSALILLSAAFAQQLASNTKPATIPASEKAILKLTATSFDFGKIVVGKPVTHEFTFTNTGNIPLVISSVQASCGCTVASYSKEPVAPGATGFIKATYNAAKAGQFSKTVTVNTNTEEGTVLLTIKGEVIDPQE